MGLVDYTSSPEDSDTEASPLLPPPPKKQRTTSSPAAKEKSPPPLPAAFHDLYASTVRPSVGDDPALHQGRRRVIPHQAGNWPSHIYIEWLPSRRAGDLLASLVAALEVELSTAATTTTTTTTTTSTSSSGGGRRPPAQDGTPTLTSFLTSDLGAPLPLHVSLSRPFVLRTDEKDAFLSELVDSIRACGVPPFALSCVDLSWHRSPESTRSFLVLRVRSNSRSRSSPNPSTAKLTRKDAAAAAADGDDGANNDNNNPLNAELSALLARCNTLVTSHDQPALYAQPADTAVRDDAATAFHISIAWSFAEPTPDLLARTAAVFARDEFRTAIPAISVPVDSVKAKIGNVVTSIALPTRGRGRGGADDAETKKRMGSSLFGL